MGRAGQRWGAKCQWREFPAENESWESTGLAAMFAACLSATSQPEVKGNSVK